MARSMDKPFQFSLENSSKVKDFNLATFGRGGPTVLGLHIEDGSIHYYQFQHAKLTRLASLVQESKKQDAGA